MEKIASFTVDHTKLKKGMYVSRVDFNDIVTYDIRMKKPNGGEYISNSGAHTMEHLFATYARNSLWKENIIYVGPMGCRTGFYLVAKGLAHEDAIRLVKESMVFIRDYKADIPGASEEECGNYIDQDLPVARAVAADMVNVLAMWTEKNMDYIAG